MPKVDWENLAAKGYWNYHDIFLLENILAGFERLVLNLCLSRGCGIWTNADLQRTARSALDKTKPVKN
jgi:hypothetical protein